MNAGLTVETLAAAYELLRTTVPFRALRLPPAHEVTFKLTKNKDLAGLCDMDDPPIISVSTSLHSHIQPMLITMAHEMIHLHQFVRYGKADHGDGFQKLAKRVCRAHGFDPKVF